MDVEFKDDDMRRLYEDGGYMGKWTPHIVRNYREVITLLMSVNDTASLYRGWKGLHIEKRKDGKYKGLFSIRLNKQWRLFLDIKKQNGSEMAVVLYIKDPH
ncbi:MAG: type II toxin-antitoxin system RelE/ParE family toxin [Candidatus Zixiibacteriota bacterium]